MLGGKADFLGEGGIVCDVLTSYGSDIITSVMPCFLGKTVW